MQSTHNNDENADPNASSLNDENSPGKLNCQSHVLENPLLSPSESSGFCFAKGDQLATPRTPRHRDALSKKVPITPRHRLHTVGKPTTPHTPRTPSTPINISTIYSNARQHFVRSANPGRLIGRERERADLSDLIEDGINSKTGRCMYVSGPPGTGKSAVVNDICGELQGREDVRTTYINCMSVKNAADVYGKLIEDLIGDTEDLDQESVPILRKAFMPKRGSSNRVYVVTLDEIDHLLTLNLEILYTLFEWALHRSSHLVLIGIANALDLTDRFLPRLKAKNLKPRLLPFLPYTVAQITSIITTKVKSLSPSENPEYTPFLHPTAIQFCAKKVASQTGDLRKAFDIVRRSIDLVESETKQKHQDDVKPHILQLSPSKVPLGENLNLSSPQACSRNTKKIPSLAESLASLTPITAPRVTIAHIARISASALGNGTPQRLQTLNLQQKAVLCALITYEKSNRQQSIFATPSKSANIAPTIRKLFEIYSALCKREDALQPVTRTEFVDVVGGLETLGLIGETDGKKGRGVLGLLTPSKSKKGEERRVSSNVNEKEVESCLEGVGGGILRAMMKGED